MAIAAANCLFSGDEEFTPRFRSRSRDENTFSNADGRSASDRTGRTLSKASKSLGVQKKGNQGVVVDSKDSLSIISYPSQVETSNLQNASSLSAVVKVYCTHTAPDYSLPWQKQRQYTSTGSAFMIGDGKLLTNAHCVEHNTQVKVKRRGDDTKYVAKVLARGVECDIALLSVESEEFWKGAEPLQLGSLPTLQDSVTVVGYPLGGETISVSKGVVSRIEILAIILTCHDAIDIDFESLAYVLMGPASLFCKSSWIYREMVLIDQILVFTILLFGKRVEKMSRPSFNVGESVGSCT
ncbi:hypothetical protein MIMGU_mgv1a0034322mg, partial [Erythranthe guttata]